MLFSYSVPFDLLFIFNVLTSSVKLNRKIYIHSIVLKMYTEVRTCKPDFFKDFFLIQRCQTHFYLLPFNTHPEPLYRSLSMDYRQFRRGISSPTFGWIPLKIRIRHELNWVCRVIPSIKRESALFVESDGTNEEWETNKIRFSDFLFDWVTIYQLFGCWTSIAGSTHFNRM